MINILRKGIKFSIQRVYFPQSYFESKHYGKPFNSIGKFKSLTFQLRAIYFHTFVVDVSVNKIFSPVGESSLLKVAAQVFEAGKRSGDYHDNMDLETFLRYIRLELIK